MGAETDIRTSSVKTVPCAPSELLEQSVFSSREAAVNRERFCSRGPAEVRSADNRGGCPHFLAGRIRIVEGRSQGSPTRRFKPSQSGWTWTRNFPQMHVSASGHILPPGVKFTPRRPSPMKRTLEVLLTTIALAGMYCAVPKSSSQVGSSGLQAEHVVLVADGSDPMPFCRGKACR